MAPSPADMMFDFVDRTKSAATMEAVRAHLQTVAENFGFDNFGVSSLPDPGQALRPLVMQSSWPLGWYERYMELGYVFADPVIHRVRISDDPFSWAEVVEAQPLRENSIRVMNEASEFGLRAGFTVPIHTLRGMQAVVTFGTRRLDMSERDRGALHMIAIYAHSRLRELFNGPGGNSSLRRPRLSPRERECVNWCAEGKSSWEIARILGIAEKTVEHHFANACAKMDVSNRCHLVAEALRTGVIH